MRECITPEAGAAESQPLTAMSESEERAEPTEPDLEPVVEKISTEHGFDLRGYKRTTLYRRIRKRMSDVRCAAVDDYLVRLETDPQEYPQLVNTVLINVTEFFRDPPAWEYLQEAVMEPGLRKRSPGEPVRVWSVGCATGEEAYGLAMLFAELALPAARAAKIYATDMDEGALAAARAGVYDSDDLRNVSPTRRQRFFEELPGGRCRVRRELRSMVIFGHHNVLEHAPISRLDLLVCRNLLIYFDAETQQQILKRFHYALREQGILFLGKAETLMSRSPFFRAMDPRHRVFQKSCGDGSTSRSLPASGTGHA